MNTLENIFKLLSKDNLFFKKVYILSHTDLLKEIVGELFAKHCTFSDYNEGTLEIECDDNLWANELRYHSKKILKRLNDKLGNNTVKKLKINIKR